MSVRTDLATIESVDDRHVQRNNTMEREKKRLLNYLRSRKEVLTMTMMNLHDG